MNVPDALPGCVFLEQVDYRDWFTEKIWLRVSDCEFDVIDG